MKNFVSFDEIQAKTLAKRISYVESERDFIINKINEKIEAAAEEGDIEVIILIFNKDFNYIEPQTFIKDYCVGKLKENGYGAFAEVLNGADVKLYISWGKVV